MAAADGDVAFFQNSTGSLQYFQVARQLQNAVADLAQTLPHGCPAIPFPSKGQCSSDASIGVGYSHSANGIPGSQDAEDINEQTSRGSKRSAEAMAFNQVQGDMQVEEDSAKRTKVCGARQLSEEEKLERRREGNRKAAQRLRQRRMETVSNLQEEIARLEQERLVYLNHIYQLAASGRSVVSENKMLRARLEALQHGATSAGMEQLPGMAKAAAHALAQHGMHCKPACSNDATSRMDFDAVRRELFSTSNAQSGALWPYAGI